MILVVAIGSSSFKEKRIGRMYLNCSKIIVIIKNCVPEGVLLLPGMIRPAGAYSGEHERPFLIYRAKYKTGNGRNGPDGTYKRE